MKSKIILRRVGNSAIISEEDAVTLEAHPDIGDFFGEWLSDNWEAVLEMVGAGVAAYFGVTELAPVAAGKAKEVAQSLANSVFSSSSHHYGAKSIRSIQQGRGLDATDHIEIICMAWSEDSLKSETCHVVYAPPEANKYFEELKEKSYVVAYSLDTNHLFSGTYPFAFGAQDDGWHNDVAVINELDINFKAVAPLDWTMIPGQGTTDAALAATNWRDCIYLFAKGIEDKRIYLNVMDKNLKWSGWNEVPGNGTTDTNLATTVYRDRLYLFAKGINDKHIYVNVYHGQHWSGWSEVPGNGMTDTSLAVTVYRDRLYLFAKGINDKHIHVNSMNNTLAWTGWSKLPGDSTTNVAPAVAVYKDSLYLFCKGIDYQGIYVNTYDGNKWSGFSEIGGTTNVALAATGSGNRLWLFSKGIDNQGIYINDYDRKKWSGWSEIGGTTDESLAVTGFGREYLYLFGKGIDDESIYVNIRGLNVLPNPK